MFSRFVDKVLVPVGALACGGITVGATVFCLSTGASRAYTFLAGKTLPAETEYQT